MQIRRSYIYKFNQSTGLRKALALSMYCKNELGIHCIDNFTYNKLHNLTGIHVTTLRKRIKTLFDNDIVYMEKSKLVFRKIHKDNKRNNISFDTTDIHTLKEYENTVASLGIVLIQMNKDFAKFVIDKCTDPKDLKEFKSAKKLAKEYGYGRKFVDKGISYKSMAKRLDISVKTAVNVVKFAVKNCFLEVKKSFSKFFSYNINKRVNKTNSPYTFSTKNNIYTVHSNSYAIGASIQLGIIRL